MPPATRGMFFLEHSLRIMFVADVTEYCEPVIAVMSTMVS
jgi:hypothetical protein